VQITNELDPFFFYSLEVNEDDFQSLKVEQCILVDFATFPYKFIELLEQCIASASNDSSRYIYTYISFFLEEKNCEKLGMPLRIASFLDMIMDSEYRQCSAKHSGLGHVLPNVKP
jgi:hypothetical protein